MTLADIWLIARYHIRFSLRTGGGLIFLLVFLFVGLGIASLFIDPVDDMVNKEFSDLNLSAKEAMEEISEHELVQDGIQWVTGSGQEQVHYLIKENPSLLSIVLLIYLMLIPFLICVGGFNQTAGDVGSKGLRFLLLRTERINIFLGRFLGTVLLCIVVWAFVLALIVIYMHFKIGLYPPSALFKWGLHGYLALILFSIPYIALCAWISGALNNAFFSLSLCFLATGIPIIVIKLVQLKLSIQDKECAWLIRTLPWGWKYDLLASAMDTRLISFGMMAIFTFLFLSLGLLQFQRRDL